MTREELRDAIASVAYDDLEGPIANQDYGRQVRQWEQCKRIADAQIAAIEAAGVRLVPSEATADMQYAVSDVMYWATCEEPECGASDVYRAFLAASPYAPKETL